MFIDQTKVLEYTYRNALVYSTCLLQPMTTFALIEKEVVALFYRYCAIYTSERINIMFVRLNMAFSSPNCHNFENSISALILWQTKKSSLSGALRSHIQSLLAILYSCAMMDHGTALHGIACIIILTTIRLTNPILSLFENLLNVLNFYMKRLNFSLSCSSLQLIIKLNYCSISSKLKI